MPPRSAPPRVNDRPVNEAAQLLRGFLGTKYEDEWVLDNLDAALRHERQQGRQAEAQRIFEQAAGVAHHNPHLQMDAVTMQALRAITAATSRGAKR